MDLNALKSMLREDQDIREIIKLKSDHISVSEGASLGQDLDESWEKAEESVVNIFLDKIEQAQVYAWEAVYDNQPDLKDANTFICILGYILAKGDPDPGRLPEKIRNKENYSVGLSYLSGLFSACNQLIVGQRLKRKEALMLFNQNDLASRALKHYVHTDPNSPYFDYHKPFPMTDGMSDQELRKALKEDQHLINYINYCGDQHQKISLQIQKMLKL